MGRIVAMFGGDLQTTEPFNKLAINMSGKENANVLFVPTASKDSSAYIKTFTEAFEKLGCQVQTVTLTKKKYSGKELDSLISWADIVYVGGGNAKYMINEWKKTNFDSKLYNAFNADSVLLTGCGAGGICWFNCGYSNSEYKEGKTDWSYIWTNDLLDILHSAVSPHYNEEDRTNFDQRLVENNIPGYGMEDNTAIVQHGEHTRYVKSVEDAKGYFMVYLNGELVRKEIHLDLVVDGEILRGVV